MTPTDSASLVIIGISGDLASRKLLPALYHLEQDSLLSDDFKIVGVSRSEVTQEQITDDLKSFIKECLDMCDESSIEKFIKRLHLTQADTSSAEGCESLFEYLKTIDGSSSSNINRLFYLSLPPNTAETVSGLLGQSGSIRSDDQILLEKPFGYDYESAKRLADLLDKYFKEDQVYRIDHYLAKETVQNILYFRFHNPIVKDIWNSKFIDHIQITVAESIGIEGRVDFYENTGAVKEFLQSHVMQLLAMTTMIEPASLEANEVRTARENVLRTLRPIKDVKAQIVSGQYQGYKQEVHNQQTKTETYVAAKLYLDDERWKNVPIYIRTGKALEKKLTEINLVYTDQPQEASTNVLTIRIQPNEGIALTLLAKEPGIKKDAKREVIMDYCYDQAPGQAIKHDAYEKLLLDAIHKDQTLFTSTNEVLSTWKFIQPILDEWENESHQPAIYPKGSWGPASADELLKPEGVDWIRHDRAICMPN